MTTPREMLAAYRVAEFARVWVNQPRPKGYRQRAARQCYYNAQRLAIDGRGTYVEGYVGPIQHAWVVDDAGRVIDPTWPHAPHAVYLGVPMRSQWVAQQVLARNEWSDLLRAASELPGTSTAVDLNALARFDAALVKPLEERALQNSIDPPSPTTLEFVHRFRP